jgi:hypothetical protein
MERNQSERDEHTKKSTSKRECVTGDIEEEELSSFDSLSPCPCCVCLIDFLLPILHYTDRILQSKPLVVKAK